MNSAPTYGVSAIASPGHLNHLMAALTPVSPRYGATPTLPTQAIGSDSVDPTPEASKTEMGHNRHVAKAGTRLGDLHQTRTEVTNLMSLGLSSTDTSMGPTGKKRKTTDASRGAFHFPQRRPVESQALRNEFLTPGEWRLPSSSRYQSDERAKTFSSCASSASGQMSPNKQLNKAFWNSSVESVSRSTKLAGNETDRNAHKSSSISTAQKTTPSSRPPLGRSSSTTGNTDDSMTAKDITCSRTRNNGHRTGCEEEQSNQVKQKQNLALGEILNFSSSLSLFF